MTRLRIANIAIAIATAAALTACVDRSTAPADTSATAPPPAVATALAEPGDLNELLTAESDSSAFPLATGSFVTGSFQPAIAGTLSSIAVQIGNYANTADGLVAIEACQKGNCAEGKEALEGSTDNGYLEIALSSPIPVVAGEPVTYRFVKVDGASPVALWLYAPTDTLSAIKVNDQTTLERTPKIAVRFAR